ncbi:MAG TPA: hypothetical protein VNX46_11820, partial [Candidatus Acidoferrum sp.]|nr:hypothetical protein [Candidatus Acidoferrum sp.]
MRRILILVLGCFGALALLAQNAAPPVTVKVEIVNPNAQKRPLAGKETADLSNIVIWLSPLGSGAGPASAALPGHPPPQITQIHKSFDPHVLVIQVGTPVQFPNKDP